MRSFRHDPVVPFKDSSLTKKEQVAEMFNRIAFRYDFLNRFLTAGIDRNWRKKAIDQLESLHPKKILDVASGTADVAIMMAGQLQPEKITGIDISDEMLNIGRQKIVKAGLNQLIDLQRGDSEAINFDSDTFDAVTVAFGVRNFERLDKGLQEMLRVLKPGGKLVVLEFSRPKTVIFRFLCSIYMKLVAPGIGKIVSKNAEAYQYLNKSVEAFPEGKEFVAILNNSGYTDTYSKTLSLGICTIYCGQKERQSSA